MNGTCHFLNATWYDDGQRVNEVAEAGKIGHVVMRHFRYIDHGILGGSIPFLTGDETGKTIFAETIAAECGSVNQLRSHAGIAVQLAPPLQEFVTEPGKRIDTALCLVVMQIDARSFDQIAIPGGTANVPASFRFAQRLVKFTEIKKAETGKGGKERLDTVAFRKIVPGERVLPGAVHDIKRRALSVSCFIRLLGDIEVGGGERSQKLRQIRGIQLLGFAYGGFGL